MAEIYFTSDLHFCHDKNFLYEPRGFSNIQEHDESIIKNWNEIIKTEDLVYVLGDCVMGTAENANILTRLNGSKILCIGNHDSPAKIQKYRELNIFENIYYAYFIKFNKINFYLSHYPTLTTNKDENLKTTIWNICGHSHIKTHKDPISSNSFHCELDACDNKPINIMEIIEFLKK